MAERVIKFRFEGDASDLERAMDGATKGIKGVGRAAQTVGDITKTALGVGLGLSIDKVREKIFQAVAAYGRFFKSTQAGNKATAEFSTALLKFSNTALKPLNAAMVGVIETVRDFLAGLDPQSVTDFGKAMAGGFVGSAKVTLKAITEIRKAFSGLGVTAELGNVILERLKVTWLLFTEGVDAAQSQVAKFQAAEANLDKVVAGHTRTVSTLDDEYSALAKSIDDATAKAAAAGGLSAPGAAAPGGAAPAPAPDVASATDDLKEYQSVLVEISTEASRAQQAAVDFADGTSGAILGAVGNIGGAIQDLTSTIGAAIAEEMATTASEIEALEERITNTTDAGAKRRLMIQKAAKEKELEDHKEAAMAAWVVGKVAAVAQAAIAIPLTIAQTLANMGATPVGIALAVAGGITAGVALAAVIAEPPPTFHAGGLVTGGNIDAVPITARRGERVLSNAAVSRLGNDTLDEVERGRMPGGRGGPIIRFNDRDLDVMHSSRLRAQGSPLNSATASATRSRYSSGKGRTG